MTSEWQVDLSREAKKQYKKLAASGLKKPSILDVIGLITASSTKTRRSFTTTVI